MTNNKLMVWGDSIIKGVTFNSVTHKLALLRDSGVRLMANILGLDLVNHAKLGCTLPAGINIIERDLEKGDTPSTALIEFGGNDCDFDWDAVSKNPELPHLPRTPLEVFESELHRLVAYIQQRGITPVLMNLPPIDDERYFDTITKGRSSENIRKFLVSPRRIYTWHERYSLAVNRVASALCCPVVELRDAFLSAWDYRNYISEDGIHPNQQGQNLIYEVLTEFFKTRETICRA